MMVLQQKKNKKIRKNYKIINKSKINIKIKIMKNKKKNINKLGF